MGALQNVKGTIKEVQKSLSKNSPTVLTCCAVLGLVATGVATYRMALKADEIIVRKKEELAQVEPENVEDKKTIIIQAAKELAPVILPTVIMGGATAACIIGSNHYSRKKIAVLSTAYALSEKTVKSLNEKMVEVVGDKKASDIKDAIIKDTIGTAPKALVEGTVLDETEKEPLVPGGEKAPKDRNVLCKDVYSGRWFKSTYEKIQIAVNRLSSDCQVDMYVSLNDLYMQPEINLEQTPMGNDLGWNIDDLDRGQLPIQIKPIMTDDGYPCLCIDYDIGLREDFRNLH